VAANNRLYIIGGYEGKTPNSQSNNGQLALGNYLGDVWEFDFTRMGFQQMRLEGPDKDLINRSNHTAVYYDRTDS
jgi:hypothetical protein